MVRFFAMIPGGVFESFLGAKDRMDESEKCGSGEEGKSANDECLETHWKRGWMESAPPAGSWGGRKPATYAAIKRLITATDVDK